MIAAHRADSMHEQRRVSSRVTWRVRARPKLFGEQSRAQAWNARRRALTDWRVPGTCTPPRRPGNGETRVCHVTTDLAVAIPQLVMQIEALETAVREIAREVQKLSAHN